MSSSSFLLVAALGGHDIDHSYPSEKQGNSAEKDHRGERLAMVTGGDR
jgi:hypothetical protein